MRRVVLAVVVAAFFAVAAPAQAAAPRYILVTGPGLSRPAVLGDWYENLDFVLSQLDAERVGEPAAARPRYDLALFWGVPARPVPTRPSDAGQHGWFWPVAGSEPAVIDLQVDGVRAPRRAPPRALAILARHGVPTSAGDIPPTVELRDCRSRGEGPRPQPPPPAAGFRIGSLVFWLSIRLRLGPPNGSAWPFVQKVSVVLPARGVAVGGPRRPFASYIRHAPARRAPRAAGAVPVLGEGRRLADRLRLAPGGEPAGDRRAGERRAPRNNRPS